MPVEFLTDEQASAYARFPTTPARSELERWGLLDDADLALVGQRRGQHSKLGFALQLVTVRALGTFLPDPLDVPIVVLDFVAGQVGVEDPSVIKRYTERRGTRFEHQAEIAAVGGYRDFSAAEAEVAGWVEDRSWTTGDGPKALFDGAVAWLREHRVLLPGVSTLARLVARVREQTTSRLYEQLAALVDAPRARALTEALETPAGARVSALEQWRRGPTTVSGKGMVAALTRVAELDGLGLDAVDLSGVPPRRVAELARYGLAAKAPALRRHPYHRQARHPAGHGAPATAAGRRRRTRAVRRDDDQRARRSGRAGRQRREAAPLAAIVQARQPVGGRGGGLLEATEASEGEQMPLELVWDAIENVVSRAELRAAVTQLRAQGYPVLDADAAHLSPYMRRHINVHGRYAFPARAGSPELRRLRDPDVEDTDDDTGS